MFCKNSCENLGKPRHVNTFPCMFVIVQTILFQEFHGLKNTQILSKIEIEVEFPCPKTSVPLIRLCDIQLDHLRTSTLNFKSLYLFVSDPSLGVSRIELGNSVSIDITLYLKRALSSRDISASKLCFQTSVIRSILY